MLLIDGVRYELWTPEKEMEEFHPIVKEHYKEIFGNNTFFIEGSKLKSEAGKGSVPDGFVIEFNQNPNWYIVEIELSSHPLYDHIVNQVGRFINGIKNNDTQRKIIEAIYHNIQDNKQHKAEFEEIIGSGEIYKYVSDLITKPPILVVIIEENTLELDEALDLLRYSPIKTIEFSTFKRAGAESVHAHLFEPLYQVDKKFILTSKNEQKSSIHGPKTITSITKSIEIVIRNPSYAKFHLFYIPKGERLFFPGFRIPFELETDIGSIQTYVISAPGGTKVGDPNAGYYIQANLVDWYRRHPDLKIGDKVTFYAIEPMKKYRLEIVK
jgi:hypothetical protein